MFELESIETGVQTAPPPTSRPLLRHSVCDGGIVHIGLAQAGVRSVCQPITKPRIPYSEPAAPITTMPFAQTGALVCE